MGGLTVYCKHCLDRVHVPDNRTGLIHTNNKYVCRNGKTVAEAQ